MPAPPRSSVEALLQEADQHGRAGRYSDARASAERALSDAEALGERGLEVRALTLLAAAQRMGGDREGALVRYGQILARAGGPEHAHDEALARAVARAHLNRVECARLVGSRASSELLALLDEGEAWLRAAGREAWRGGVLHQRAAVLEAEGRAQEAVALAEEGLSLAEAHGDAPGYPRATHRRQVGDLLRAADRTDEARRHYLAALEDPAAPLHVQVAAHLGLGFCALASKSFEQASESAQRAVALAERLGGEAVCAALELQARVHRARRDLAASREAAERQVALARSLGLPQRLYSALRDLLDVELDERRVEPARALLEELAVLVPSLPGVRGRDACEAEVRARRDELSELSGEPARRPSRRLKR